MSDLEKLRIANALSVASQYATIDGDHHKAWVIDQMVRALHGLRGRTGPNGTIAEFEGNRPDYDNWVSSHRGEWNKGIAP